MKQENDLIRHVRDQVSWLRLRMVGTGELRQTDRINDTLHQLQIEMNEKDALIEQYRAVKKSYRQWEKVKSTTPSHPK